MAQEPQPPIAGPLAGDGSTASPEEQAMAKPSPATGSREKRSFGEDDVEKPYLGGPIGPDGDDDPDERGSEYCPVEDSGPAKP